MCCRLAADHGGVSLGSKWSVLLLGRVMQEAMSEVLHSSREEGGKYHRQTIPHLVSHGTVVDNDHITIGIAESNDCTPKKNQQVQGNGSNWSRAAWNVSRVHCRAQGKEKLPAHNQALTRRIFNVVMSFLHAVNVLINEGVGTTATHHVHGGIHDTTAATAPATSIPLHKVTLDRLPQD